MNSLELFPFKCLINLIICKSLIKMNSSTKLRWKSDFDKYVILVNFEKRQWQHCSGDDD